MTYHVAVNLTKNLKDLSITHATRPFHNHIEKAISIICCSLIINCKVTLSVNIITTCAAWRLFYSNVTTVYCSKTLREAVLLIEIFPQVVYIFLSRRYSYIICS